MFKVGDILFGDHGYSMELPTWYKVEKVTKTQVVVTKLEDRVVSSDAYGQSGYKMPTDHMIQSKTYRCKVKSSNWFDYVMIMGNVFSLWDGSKKYFNYMD